MHIGLTLSFHLYNHQIGKDDKLNKYLFYTHYVSPIVLNIGDSKKNKGLYPQDTASVGELDCLARR